MRPRMIGSRYVLCECYVASMNLTVSDAEILYRQRYTVKGYAYEDKMIMICMYNVFGLQ